MYERFFGLRERPFDLVPNPRFLFLTPRQREALSTLQYGVTTPRGLTLLLGDAGTGKTTLVHAMLSALEGDGVECVLLSNPTLKRAEFYEFLAAGFGLGADAAASKTRFLFELRRRLLARREATRSSTLLVDEAQSVPSELLEEIRLLSNIETATEKLLNIVLVGQPELGVRLNEPGLRQLKQRISLRCELAPFDFHETAAYIAGRLRIAGGDPAGIFTREAILAIHEVAGGVPRSINVLCDNVLIGGFASQVKPVVRAMVEEVCRDFDLKAAASAAADRTGEASVDSAFGGNLARQPAVPAPQSRHPVALEAEAEVPMFGTFGRKRRFSFF